MTYPNQCQLQVYSCRRFDSIHLKSQGPCPGDENKGAAQAFLAVSLSILEFEEHLLITLNNCVERCRGKKLTCQAVVS